MIKSVLLVNTQGLNTLILDIPELMIKSKEDQRVLELNFQVKKRVPAERRGSNKIHGLPIDFL